MNKLLLFLSLLIFHYSFSIAEVRYVSHSVTNTPPYLTWETAADSIMSAINISSFGDTIYVGNGVYKERVIMIPGLLLIGAGADSCIVNSSSVTNPPGTYSIRVTDSCYLAGFQIIPYIDISQGIGIYIYDVNIENIYAVVEKNKIINAKDGIRITSSSLGTDETFKLVRMNILSNVMNGIYSSQTAPIILENIIYPKGF